MVSKLFRHAKKETEGRISTKDQSTIHFLDLFSSLLSKSYEEYNRRKVKLWLPLIACILQGPESARSDWKTNVLKNFKDLMKLAFVFLVQETSVEFTTCMVRKGYKYLLQLCHSSALTSTYLSEEKSEIITLYLDSNMRFLIYLNFRNGLILLCCITISMNHP